MNLAAAATPKRTVHRTWRRASASELTDHGAPCCARARAWLAATGRSYDFAATDRLGLAAPVWLNARYAWGPTRWPLAWCEAVRAPAVDCGVFAAFARELFAAKGVAVFPAQIVKRNDPASVAHWRRKWAAAPAAFAWIDGEDLYHEVCLVRTGEDVARLYDPTDGVWLDPRVKAGHNAPLAVRAEVPRVLRWGDTVLTCGQWTEVGHG